MKARNLKLIGIVVLIGLMACVVTHAGKDEGKKVSIPDAVKAAISKLYPQATIEEAKLEKEGLEVYEVELKQDGQEIEVTVAPDGTIVDVRTGVAIDGLPAAVKAAIAQAAANAEIKEVKQETTYYIVTLKKLETPQISYEAEFTQNGKKVEVELAADGTILKQKVEDEDKDKECKNDKDKDEDEQQVSIEQVPAAVKATILKEAEGGTIKKIESGTENGKTIYEADAIINGKEVEVKVAADGTLLSKEAKGTDDDDNDSDDEK